MDSTDAPKIADPAAAGGLTEDEIAGSVAIIGMACRFPGADSLEAFWSNLERGVESVSFFDREELEAEGVSPQLLDAPGFVPAKPALDGVDRFDASFFGVPAREAEILDPQHRLFLEVAWEGLERSGYAVEGFPGWIGLFAGVSFPSYWVENLARRPDLVASVGPFQVFLANDRDYFATRASYLLDLKGPSVNVQSACSTSLVAVHLACQSLLDHQSDLALAGGCRVHLPRVSGYLYQEGGIVSPDGHCRPFDAAGAGSIFGDGVGVVVLKRLEDALADGDTIDAVIRGSAMNNDGSGKVGYTAPSVDGQADAIALAQEVAGVDPASVTYVEAHGSGTPLGDPIEVAALTEVFRRSTDRTSFCAIGSVKSNFGHLEAAAGVAGLIKAVLALKHRRIPPTLHCRRPNPRIDWETSPFRVATHLAEWPAADGVPRRAGVSSFGIGGTNVHVVLEEAPEPTPPAPSRRFQLLALSARTPDALEAATDRLVEHLEGTADDELPDVAFTSVRGRRRFEHRRALVCATRREAVEALRSRDPERLLEGAGGAGDASVVFLVSGLGDHYPGMARRLYDDEPVFRTELDRAAEVLAPRLGLDVRDVLWGKGSNVRAAPGDGLDLRAMLGRDPGRDTAGSGGTTPLDRVGLLHPVLFALEHALGRLWMSFGIEPAALLGYSLGEYVAACLAGVLDLEDALAVVAERARLVEEAASGGPGGAMLAIPEDEETLRTRLGPDLSVAAVNGPAMTVVAGPAEAVADLEQRLASAGVAGRRLPARHAFHTLALEPCAAPLAETLARVDLRPPRIPVVSNVSGTWLADAEATDPGYWARHLVSPVRFGAGLSTLLGAGHRTFVEIGPGQGLGSLVVQQAEAEPAGGPVVVPSLPAAFDGRDDVELLLRSLSRLWLAGVTPGDELWAGEARRRVHLPTYPFERRRFWIDPPARTGSGPDAVPAAPPAGEDRGAPRLASVHDRPRVGTPYAEPATELERRVAEVWGEVLGIRRPGAHDDFFELGGNSLIVPQALLRVRQSLALDHDLPVQALLQAPTVSSFARTLERMADEGPGALLGSEAVDLWAESELEPEVRPAGETARPLRPETPTAVLLTGGTGFFGAFLLERLLEATSGRVYCLVRAEDREAGRARLEQALGGYGLWYPELAERIEPVPGDLTRPGLGLDPTVRDELATTVEAVYHAGAWVNFTYPYRTLAPANVDGTREALRFAVTGAPKPFHFVSSIAVFAPGSLGPGGIAYEDSPLEATEGLFSGYAETKWVAERLVAEAGHRGLPVTVHRPGVIGGSARTGAGNPRDLVWNLLKGCIQLGLVPRGIGLADVAPADYVAGALVHASLRPESAGKAFHYPNPHPTPWDDVFATVAKFGYRLRPVPFAEWREALLRAVEEGRDNALAPFIPLLPQTAGAGARSGVAAETSLRGRTGDDDTNTRTALRGSGTTCPPLDETLLGRYLEAFVDQGFLPRPARPAPDRGASSAPVPEGGRG